MSNIPPNSADVTARAARPRVSLWLKLLLLVVLVLRLVSEDLTEVTAIENMHYILTHQDAGVFDRGACERLVAAVRQLGLPPGASDWYRVADLAHPETLHLVQDKTVRRGEGAGDVYVAVTAAGKLKVVIETRDLGHAGEYGFAYSDELLSLQPESSGGLVLDVPSHLRYAEPDMKIDDHWWQVNYNLD